MLLPIDLVEVIMLATIAIVAVIMLADGYGPVAASVAESGGAPFISRASCASR